MQISDVAAGVGPAPAARASSTSWVPPDLADKIAAEYQDPLVDLERGERLGLQHPDLRRVPDREHLGADRAGVEGQGRAAGSARQGVLHRLVQPDGDARATQRSPPPTRRTTASSSRPTRRRRRRPGSTALAANGPLLTDADEAAAQAVGAPDQTEPFVGLMSSAKFRNNIEAGAKLGICDGAAALGRLDVSEPRADRSGHRQPERGEALHPLPADRGGHRAAGRRRQDVDQRRRQAAGRRAVGHRRGGRTDLPLRRRERRRTTGTPGRTGRICGGSATRSKKASRNGRAMEETKMQIAVPQQRPSIAALFAAAVLAASGRGRGGVRPRRAGRRRPRPSRRSPSTTAPARSWRWPRTSRRSTA